MTPGPQARPQPEHQARHMDTVNELLMHRLRCLSCHAAPLRQKGDHLICGCGERFPVRRGVPSLLRCGPEGQDWNVWDLDEVKMIASSYYKRATGELPEKESSKSYARLLARRGLYEPGDAILDLGCASGHFYRSLRDRLDPDVRYVGTDINAQFLLWGCDAYGPPPGCAFVHCDALDMPFADKSFDLVLVNLFHFFPNVEEAMREALRVARKMVVWRTPVGVTNYMVKIVYDNDFETTGPLDCQGTGYNHNLCMLYSRPYIKGLARALDTEAAFIERDTDFQPFDNTALEEFGNIPSTRTVGDMQINGNLWLDWHYVGIPAPGYAAPGGQEGRP